MLLRVPRAASTLPLWKSMCIEKAHVDARGLHRVNVVEAEAFQRIEHAFLRMDTRIDVPIAVDAATSTPTSASPWTWAWR